MGTELSPIDRDDLPSGTAAIGRILRTTAGNGAIINVVAVSDTHNCTECAFHGDKYGGCVEVPCTAIIWVEETEFLTNKLTK